MAWRLKAGIVEPEETVVAKQCLRKQVPAATNTHAKKLLVGTHRQREQGDLRNLLLVFRNKEKRLVTMDPEMLRQQT
jgi:hypothetical protein